MLTKDADGTSSPRKYFSVDAVNIASYCLAALALFIVLYKGLLVALLSGLLVYSLVHQLAPLLGSRLNNRRARIVAITFLGGAIVIGLTVAIWSAVAFFQSGAGNLQTLMRGMADILENSRNHMPDWLRSHLPENVDQIRLMATEWLRSHALEAKTMGEQAGRVVVHLFLGMIIGAMVALHDSTADAHSLKPLANALRQRLLRLRDAFRQIVFAQLQIALINATLMALYVLLLLPLAGIHLPLVKSLVVITFVVGMIPVAGNLVSNTMLVIVGLSHSPQIAALSLLYMVLVHKLEYFLNARIIGAKISAQPWELLIAMIVVEALFGIPGLVAAPILYAYVKQELVDAKMV